jgi:hypothetical protein
VTATLGDPRGARDAEDLDVFSIAISGNRDLMPQSLEGYHFHQDAGVTSAVGEKRRVGTTIRA